MLHAPACENRRRKSSSPTGLSSENRREMHPPLAAHWQSSELNHAHGTYGNQAVLRLLSRSGPSIQTKLAVNQPGDVFEQEADRVADQVMRMEAPGLAQRNGGEQRVQRKCTQCEEDEKKTGLQKKEAGAGPQFAPPSVQSVLNSPGRPLDPGVRSFMEPRFGYDFGQVRVHDDQSASKSARDVDALAYTVGHHIAFRDGRGSDRLLMAHELTHVIQQDGARKAQVQRQPETDEEEQNHPAAGPSETGQTEKTKEAAPADHKVPEAPKVPKGACTRTILSEGSCADLVAGSRFICCDPDNGFERKGRTKDVEDTDCPDQKFSPVFTCDHNCKNALKKGCSDSDNWMAIPPGRKEKCGDVFTICANGKSTTGYMRDRSTSHHSFEVSPGIQKALGVKVGSSFEGSVYRPGAKAATIAADKCCNS